MDVKRNDYRLTDVINHGHKSISKFGWNAIFQTKVLHLKVCGLMAAV